MACLTLRLPCEEMANKNKSLSDLFNSRQEIEVALKQDLDQRISEAALSGQFTGFIPRADQTGYQRMVELQQSADEEKEDSEFRFLMLAISTLNNSINNSLTFIAQTVEELYELAEQLLDDIHHIHDQIKRIEDSHSEALSALANHDVDISEVGVIKNKALRQMADHYCKRTGSDAPMNPLALNIMIKEQIEYEKDVLIPWLETHSEKLGRLHDRIIANAQEISQEHKTLEGDQDRVNELPHNAEKLKQLNDIDKAVEIERKEAEHFKASTQKEKTRLEKEIEAVRVSHDVSSAGLEEKARDASNVDELSFSPQAAHSPSKAPQPGR